MGDGPFSLTQHRQPVRLGWLYEGGTRCLCRAPFTCICVKSIFSHAAGFKSVPDGPQGPPRHPLPHCWLFKVTSSEWGQRGQWSRRDVVPSQWKLDPAPSMSPPPPHSHTLLCPQLFQHPLPVQGGDDGGGAAEPWLRGEVSSQNWSGRRTAVRIRRWSVAF